MLKVVVKRTSVFRSLIAIGLLLPLISCSFSSGNSAKRLPLPLAPDVEEVGENLYRVQSNSSYAYFTAIEECNEKLPLQTALARSRQLFVGLEGLKIKTQSAFELEGKRVSVVAASADVEGSPFDVVTYSVRKGDCYFDVVFWSQMEKIGSETVSLDPLRHTELAKTILPSLLSGVSDEHS